jgi:predicted DCC family thiol-disulfide oxidoreductase YuxK
MRSSSAQTAALLYDRDCGFCTRAVARILARDRHHLAVFAGCRAALKRHAAG